MISKWTGSRHHVEPMRPSRKEVQRRWVELQETWEQQKAKRKEPRRQKLQKLAPLLPLEAKPPKAPKAPKDPKDPKEIFAPAACCGLRSAVRMEIQDAWQGVGVVPRPDSRQEKRQSDDIIKSKAFDP